jgi:hypothetical protein
MMHTFDALKRTTRKVLVSKFLHEGVVKLGFSNLPFLGFGCITLVVKENRVL